MCATISAVFLACVEILGEKEVRNIVPGWNSVACSWLRR
jgi:hypothetical protein